VVLSHVVVKRFSDLPVVRVFKCLLHFKVLSLGLSFLRSVLLCLLSSHMLQFTLSCNCVCWLHTDELLLLCSQQLMHYNGLLWIELHLHVHFV
jgi:hypothetical protein